MISVKLGPHPRDASVVADGASEGPVRFFWALGGWILSLLVVGRALGGFWGSALLVIKLALFNLRARFESCGVSGESQYISTTTPNTPKNAGQDRRVALLSFFRD